MNKLLKILLFSILAIAGIIFSIVKYNQITIKKCADSTNLYRYAVFSKSSDPIKNEYQAKFNYKRCLSNRNFLFRYKRSGDEKTCMQTATKVTGGKAEMLFPISAEDYYEFDNSAEYTGFTTYVNLEYINCLKR